MNKSARHIAFETLYKIFYNDAYSNIAVDNALSDLNESKGFVTRIVYGVVERKLTLDYLINKYCSKPKPKVLIILRMGVYQIYFMDKVSSAAAIDESVKLAKSVGLEFYSKLINAVLHKIDDNRINIDEIDDPEIRYSIPVCLINMWKKAYGEDAVYSFLPCLNEKAPIFAVPNTMFVDKDELQFEFSCEDVESEVDGELVSVLSNLDVKKSKAYKNGLFHIEDLSCYNAVKALNPQEGDVVIDVCSAPGGKAFTCAEMMNNIGKIYACDISEHRVKLIKNGADRLELSSVTPMVNDATVYNNNLPMADKIICDVVCSGFGIIRRKPEIRYKNLDSIKNLPEIQYNILDTSAQYLKNGGKILYSTCTLNKRENKRVVEKFIANHTEYKIVEMKTIFPSQNGGDGFFYSVIERN